MTYYIFKAPFKQGDMPVEKIAFEPSDFLIQQKAMKYGAVVVMNDDELKRRSEES